uniref:Sphingosine-1-phosphate receptor 1 n=1 Tax=Labrus bergylta TaxID=56723 RepID=A0A3Q3EKZ3_9LABR
MFVALAASVFSLLMKLHNNGNTFRVFLLISTVWMIAAVLGGLPVMGWKLHREHDGTYILFCTTVFSIILMAIVVLYARIYASSHAQPQARLPQSHQRSRECGANIKSSEKSMALLKTVIIVLSCFIACWAPLFVLLLLDAACETLTCPILYKAEWFLALAVLNSAMNPLIYTLTSNEMRRASSRRCSAALPGSPNRSKSDNSSHPKRRKRRNVTHRPKR